ncbi:MAG: aldehyde dehydrogenase [Verrucomicrobia bacterium]|nr:MAG: aldehyde dehydrogenase [Verrucomicrobiota bacterium]
MSYPSEPFINGRYTSSATGQPTNLINPATEEVFASVSSVQAKDVDEAIEGADRAFRQSWRDIPPGRRAEILFNIAKILRANVESIAQLESRCVGKPIADARDEVALGARVFEFYAGAVSKFGGQTLPVSRGGFDFTLRQPMGVVAAIVPWNFPFPIACWKVAPALAAGNTVVLKPASISPLSALLLGQLSVEAGLPAGVLQVLPGSGREIGNQLVLHPMVRKISFTGSTEVGRGIMELAARGLKRVSLELGGKSPNIVFADADIEQAATNSPMSVFGNTGQDCCARSRVLVERKVMDCFVEKFIAATKKLIIGDPASEATQIGPLVSAGQRAVVEDFMASARSQKRSIVSGGQRWGSKGYFFEPTIILEPEITDRVWREEIFGPVVCIRAFDDESEMIEEVNDSPYGLSGSIWTHDIRRALRVARRVESGVLSINSHSSVHVEAPFGGFKQSGLGRDLGMAAMEGYTELKNIYIAD